MQQNTNQQEFSIIAYDLAAFLTQFQEAVVKGYHLDMTRNETYPQMINNQYWVTLVQSGKGSETVGTIELKIDASEAKEIVEKALEEVNKGTQDAVVIPAALQDDPDIKAGIAKAKVGRKPKGE